jgi:uncharacterized membrane protein YagU involved in acid resistance
MSQRKSRSLDPRIFAVGLIAGIAFGMMQMIIEALIGRGLWSPLRYIASVFTLGKDTDPSFSLIPVVVGLVGHMMNSIILGMVFALLISPLIKSTAGLAVAGMAYGAVVFLAMWYLILPVIDPAMKLVNGPGFFISHLMYGLILGVGIALVRGQVGARLIAAGA